MQKSRHLSLSMIMSPLSTTFFARRGIKAGAFPWSFPRLHVLMYNAIIPSPSAGAWGRLSLVASCWFCTAIAMLLHSLIYRSLFHSFWCTGKTVTINKWGKRREYLQMTIWFLGFHHCVLEIPYILIWGSI
jgi:hypothetical protein